jgi:hypothetical protein
MTQLLVELGDTPTPLSRLTQLLSDAGVPIGGVSLFPVTKDAGLAQFGEDHGALPEAVHRLVEAGINVICAQALAGRTRQALVIIHTDTVRRAMTALGAGQEENGDGAARSPVRLAL